MNAITIVLRSGMGMTVDAVRPYLRPGMPIAIGRAGAVIAEVSDGNAIEGKRQAAASAAGYIDSVERYMESAGNLESAVAGLESALIGIDACAAKGQREPWAALRRIREIAAAFLDNSGASAERASAGSGASAKPANPGGAAARRHVNPLKPGIFDVITGTANLPPQAAQELPAREEHMAQIERVSADLREHGPYRVQLKPCSFCGGPPVPFVQLADQGFGSAPRLDSYGDDGLAVETFVSCHECGARGPIHEDDIFDASDYDSALEAGVDLWQSRDERHAYLYLAGEAEGLNLFPRPDRASEGGET